jgi:hypothetical protein
MGPSRTAARGALHGRVSIWKLAPGLDPGGKQQVHG